METLKSGTPEQKVIANLLERLALVEQGLSIIAKTYESSVLSRGYIETHPALLMMRDVMELKDKKGRWLWSRKTGEEEG